MRIDRTAIRLNRLIQAGPNAQVYLTVETWARHEIEELLPPPCHATLDLTKHQSEFDCNPYMVSGRFIYVAVPREQILVTRNLKCQQASGLLQVVPEQAELDTLVRIMALYAKCCSKKVVLTRDLSVSNNSCQDDCT